MQFKRFSELCLSGAVKGKRVFIRADLNVPQDESGNITEDTRIRASIPCIRMALDAGAADYFAATDAAKAGRHARHHHLESANALVGLAQR